MTRSGLTRHLALMGAGFAIDRMVTAPDALCLSGFTLDAGLLWRMMLSCPAMVTAMAVATLCDLRGASAMGCVNAIAACAAGMAAMYISAIALPGLSLAHLGAMLTAMAAPRALARLVMNCAQNWRMTDLIAKISA